MSVTSLVWPTMLMVEICDRVRGHESNMGAVEPHSILRGHAHSEYPSHFTP